MSEIELLIFFLLGALATSIVFMHEDLVPQIFLSVMGGCITAVTAALLMTVLMAIAP